MPHQDEERALNPWVWVGVGLVAAGIGVGLGLMMWHHQPDRRARRLISTSERLIEQMSKALDDLKQQSAAAPDGR